MSRDATAISAHDTVRPGTPATWAPSSPVTMSSGLASIRWPAICCTRTSTSLEAASTALPAVCSDREPRVPAPRGTAAVSELMSRIFSIGMPSTSLATMANAV